jgi:hypothetical protein
MKNSLIKLTLWAIRQLYRIYRLLTKNPQSGSSLVSLAPQVNETESQKFLECLSDALENKTIKNIAVSGIYGSGKSTFLKTFEYYHKEYSYLNISLASFNDCFTKKGNFVERGGDNSGNEDIRKSVIHDNLLEKSILQQMIYHVKNKSLPDSRLKRITHLPRNNVLIRSILIAIWLVSIFMIVRFRLWSGLDVYITSFDKITSAGFWLSYSLIILVFAIGLVFSISFVTRLLNNAQFSKLNLKTVEIKLFDDKTPSVLNHHLDEILYFFEATNFDVVIFEDLDRFNNTDIFVKLRELNILINKSEQIGRDVTFIYAIKDDMFANEERTKFFDFIIPIIPVITSTNSKQKLIDRLKQLGLIDIDLSEEFLSDISLYISDMRVLNNIVNEFIIYKQRIGDNINQLKADKLFSMVVYKNIYPTDFANLHKNNGILFDAINSRKNHANNLTQTLSNKISELKTEIENIQNETLNATSELRAIYIIKLIEFLPNNRVGSVWIDNNQYSINQLCNDNLFLKLKEMKNIRYGYDGYTASNNVSFSKVEKSINNMTYDEREKIIKNKNNKVTDSLKQEISDLENEINKIKSYSLSELINKFDIKWTSDIENKDLLKFLIRHGLINEEYKDYISYFYPGSISANDKDFLLSIKNHSYLGHDYSLDNLEEVIKSIREYEFQQKEVLNFNLIEFLLANHDKYQQQSDLIFKQLSNENESSVRFINNFIQNNQEHLAEFIKMICASWEGFWVCIEKEPLYEDKKIYNYLKLIVTHATLKDIKTLNQSCFLSNYISSQKDFLHIIDDAKRLKQVIDSIPIKFESLEISDTDRDKSLLEHIYKNDYYIINEEMIELILKTFNTEKSINLKKLKTANYTTVMQSDCEDLQSYIGDNILDYLHSVFFSIGTNTKESEESIISLLNDEDIDIDDKIAIIENGETIISKLSDINDVDLWGCIIGDDKCKMNWNNIVAYYTAFGEINETLKEVFNNVDHCKKLSKEIFDKKEDINISLRCALLLFNDTSDDCYSYYIESIPFCYETDFDFSHLSENKVIMMLKNKNLGLSIENYNLLREKFFGHHITLLKKWFDKFLCAKDFSDYACDANDYSELLLSEDIATSQKDGLIQTFCLSIYKDQQTLSNLVGKIILETRNNIDYDLLNQLVVNGSDPKMKIGLLLHQFDKLDETQITSILKNSKGDYAKIAQKGRRPLLDDNPMNYELVTKLREIKYISSFKKDKKKCGIRVNTKWF